MPALKIFSFLQDTLFYITAVIDFILPSNILPIHPEKFSSFPARL